MWSRDSSSNDAQPSASEQPDASAPAESEQAVGSGAPQTSHAPPVAGSGGSASSPPRTTAAAGGAAALPPAIPSDPVLTDGAIETPLVPMLFWADVINSRLWRANLDGSERTLVMDSEALANPDGVAIAPEDGFVYSTNMGTLAGGGNVGTLTRMQLDTQDIETVIPAGTTNTPKQIRIDHDARKLYWCDREGAKVWRSSLDGSDVEVLVRGHGMIQLVGLGLDVAKRQLYFSDRMARKIYRAGFDIPDGADADTRNDVETILSFETTSMPLDIELDLDERQIYWTDRVRGMILRASMDFPAEQNAYTRADVTTVIEGLVEPIGISFDHVDRVMYFSQLGGEIGRVNLKGTDVEMLVSAGSASGLTIARLPASLMQ